MVDDTRAIQYDITIEKSLESIRGKLVSIDPVELRITAQFYNEETAIAAEKKIREILHGRNKDVDS